MPVVISFDPAKRASNLAKHGLDLAEAERVLAGPCESRVDDRFDYGEERWISVGLLWGESWCACGSKPVKTRRG
jgi:uncharacterized DUF497 family protein